MLANQVRNASGGLREVRLDLSGNLFKAPWLGPLVDALRLAPGLRTVVIRLRQLRLNPTVGTEQACGALRWSQIVPDVRRMLVELPHLQRLELDLVGVVGVVTNMKYLRPIVTSTVIDTVVIHVRPPNQARRGRKQTFIWCGSPWKPGRKRLVSDMTANKASFPFTNSQSPWIWTACWVGGGGLKLPSDW